MPDALFVPDADTFVPTDLARGPWARDALHGGPTGALAVHAAEGAVAGADPPMHLARITVELLRPVPMAPLHVTAEVVRPGRKVSWVAVAVEAGGALVARAQAQFIRTTPVDVPLDVTPPPPPTGPGPVGRTVPRGDWDGFHNAGTEMRFVRGTFHDPGPVAVWIRLCQPVVEGTEPSGAELAVAVGDFGNGVSQVLPFERFLFINPDLTVALARPVVGEWVCLDAVTHITAGGVGLAESTLYDEAGYLGRAVQTLLVDER